MPRTVGRNEFTSQQPLKHIDRLMQECSGTAIVAFERLYIQDGSERRGSDQERLVKNTGLPTVWNQVEAAMAYVRGHPLLVIVEDGLRREALLEPNYDWYVQRVRLDASILHDREFTGIFSDWKRLVEDSHAAKQRPSKTPHVIAPSNLTVGELFLLLTPAQVWKIGAAVAGLMSAAALAGYRLGPLVASGP